MMIDQGSVTCRPVDLETQLRPLNHTHSHPAPDTSTQCDTPARTHTHAHGPRNICLPTPGTSHAQLNWTAPQSSEKSLPAPLPHHLLGPFSRDRSYGKCTFSFIRRCQAVFQSGVPFTFPLATNKGCSFTAGLAGFGAVAVFILGSLTGVWQSLWF